MRHGVNQAPKSGTAAKRGKFEKMEMGYLHIDSSELRLESGKQPLIVAIDRVTKFTYVAFSTPRQNREHSIGDQSSALKVGFWSTYEGFRSSARSVALLMVAKR